MTLTRRLLADYRRAFMWWSLGMVIMVGSTVGLWPSIRGQDQLEELMRDLPAALRSLFGGGEGISFISPPGYLQSRLFSLLLPVLLLVFGIGVGARAVGGAEESGNLELLLAHPVSRARLVAERYLATVGLSSPSTWWRSSRSPSSPQPSTSYRASRWAVSLALGQPSLPLPSSTPASPSPPGVPLAVGERR